MEVLSEHSAVLFHILLTIHNLYLIITSHQGDDDEESNETDANPIESGINGKSDRNSTAAATTTIIGTEEEGEEEGSGCHEVASFGCSNSLYISISSYSSASSSGYSSAASPTTISYLNGSLSDSSLSLSAVAAEATKSDHNYYCGNDTISWPYKRRLRRWTSSTSRRRLKLLHFRHSFCSSSRKDFR